MGYDPLSSGKPALRNIYALGICSAIRAKSSEPLAETAGISRICQSAAGFVQNIQKSLESYWKKYIIETNKSEALKYVAVNSNRVGKEDGKMRLSGEKKAAGLRKRVKQCICGVFCSLLLTETCLAAEAECSEMMVDGQSAAATAEQPESEILEQYQTESTHENVEELETGQPAEKEMITDEKMTELLAQIETSLPQENGSWSVYICDLKTGSEGCMNEQSMQAASLIKLYIMGAVYENYEQLTEQYGKEEVDARLYSMITVSDNEASNVLTGYLGGGDTEEGMRVVSDFCLEHGYTCSSMGRLLLQNNTAGDNYTSVTDCGRFLKAIYEQEKETFSHTEEMFSMLKEQTRRHKIPAQMPEGVSVANKTGELADVENDAGILYQTENDLVIVFMSENLSDAGAAQQTIAAVSRQIYDFYNE